jgi:phosphoglycerol transferase
MAPKSNALAVVPPEDAPPSEVRRWRSFFLTGGAYAGAAVLTVVLTIVVLKLWRADLRVPFEPGSDTPAHQMVVKAVMDHPWYLTNPNLGMPAAFETHDFPFVVGDSFHLLVIKLMGLFTGNSALVMNLYFLLGFPLATLTSMLALRRLGCSYPSAFVAGVLFAFLPFHTKRQEIHIFLATYYAVPLQVLVLAWLGEEQPLFTHETRRRTAISIGICALVAATGTYQAFFGGVLLLMVGAIASVRYRSTRHALAVLALGGTIAAVMGLQSLPVLIHRIHQGPNPAVAQRPVYESEMYGLEVAQLALPMKDHRFKPFNELTKPLYAGRPLEGTTASLGMVGAAGFLALLGSIMLRSRARPNTLRDRLAEANLAAVLFASIGGFSAIFALLVTSQFRAHNRMCLYIGCLALFAVALALDWVRRLRGPRWHLAAAGVVLALGLWDQTSDACVRNYAGGAAMYRSDADLVKRVEASVPAGAMIFELPYVPFPEGGYDLLRPYFHSSSLRWSFPTMKGRPTALWQQTMAARPPAELIDGLVAAGFDGVLIQRFLLPHRIDVEIELTKLLAQPAVISRDGQFSFFSLVAYRQRGRSSR